MQKPLRICIFTETYYPVIGGGETQAQLLAEGLISKGHTVILLTRRSDKSLLKYELVKGIPVHRLSPTGSGQLKKWGLILSCIPALIRLRTQYDLLFISGFRIVGISSVLLCRLMGKKSALKADSQGEMSGTFFEAGLKKFGLSRKSITFRLFLQLRNSVLRLADAFTAISQEIAEELESNAIPHQKINLIPNCVDTRRFFPVDHAQKLSLRTRLNLLQSATIVSYTGRLVSYKGLPLLVQVWKEIVKNTPDATLLLIGTGGLDIHNCEIELRKYVQENQLEKWVLFTGSVDNVPEYLQASDIFAFPTENDAFPSSLVEAMTCALPVVTTPVGAIKDIIKDNKNGLMVIPGDFESLFNAIQKLIADPSLATSIGEEARKTVQDRYSAETVTNLYINLFQQV